MIAALELHDVTLVGHDIGGLIVCAYLLAYPDELERAVIVSVAVSGIDPWSEIKRIPDIWHFAFHAVPELPEKLVAGNQAAYFGFFYDRVSARPEAVSDEARQTYVTAYARPDALHTGFERYRGFAQDEKDNAASEDQPVQTPVLYVRGEKSPGPVSTNIRVACVKADCVA